MGDTSVFTKRLKEARLALGISQKNLGIQAGVDQFVASARINQYERGKHVPDLLMAERIAEVLRVPVSYLFEPDDDIAQLLCLVSKLPKRSLSDLIVLVNAELKSSPIEENPS